MLKQSFIHIPGIGKKTEQEIWKSGALTWEDVIDDKQLMLSSQLRQRIKNEASRSIEELEKGNLQFFAKTLPKSEHWRAYNLLKKKCCYLDIETSGLSKSRDIITLIGLNTGKESKMFIEGKNMTEFIKEIKNYDMVVTYNGACFDLPFIKNKIESVSLPIFHVDLRFAMRNIGFSGGLKKIEREIGLERDDEIKDIDGFEAVRLWKEFKRGNNDALAKLIAYNKADIENLRPMMELAYQRLLEKTFIYHKI